MYIPHWAVVATFYSWKFVCGAFGYEVTKPWKANFCTAFWGSFMGFLGFPIVLLFWALRIIFGKGRAQRIAERLEFAGGYLVVAAPYLALFCAFVLVVAATVVLILSLVFWWVTPLSMYLGVVLAITAIGVLVLVENNLRNAYNSPGRIAKRNKRKAQKRLEAQRRREEAETAKEPSRWKQIEEVVLRAYSRFGKSVLYVLKFIVLTATSLLRNIGAGAKFFFEMFVAFKNKHCPIVVLE